jgi:hypothetical protein
VSSCDNSIVFHCADSAIGPEMAFSVCYVYLGTVAIRSRTFITWACVMIC